MATAFTNFPVYNAGTATYPDSNFAQTPTDITSSALQAFFGNYSTAAKNNIYTYLWRDFLYHNYAHDLTQDSSTHPSSLAYFTADHQQFASYTDSNFTSSTYNSDKFVESFFKSSMLDFFYVWLPSKGVSTSNGFTAVSTDVASIASLTPTSTTTDIRGLWKTYFSDPNRDLTGKRENTIIFWVWNLLLETLQNLQQIAPSQIQNSLIWLTAEKNAVNKQASVVYGVQSSGSDYATQTANMLLQKDVEVWGKWKDFLGKQEQTAQQYGTQTVDGISDLGQLMSTLMQQMETNVNSVIKR